jgi:alkylation response protein AidB-like acyl-CoA dehydrogenase
VLGTAVLLTEVGRRAAPVPALATLMTGVLPVVRWGDSDLRRALLPPAAAGEMILTAGIREPSNPMPLVPAATVTAGTVSGTKVGVPYCAEAGRVLLPVNFGQEGGTGVVIVDPAAAGACVTRCGSTGFLSSTSLARTTAWRTCTSWQWRARAAWPTAPWPRLSR